MSSIGEIMLAQIDEAPVAFIKVKQAYRPSENRQVFLIVEGRDDCSFYEKCADTVFGCARIEAEITVEPAGRKSNLLRTYWSLDWSEHRKCRVLFFIDRDYSDYNDEAMPNDENIYITDGYSLENSLCGEETFVSVMKSNSSRNTGLEKDEIKAVREIYRKAESALISPLREITIHQIAWSRRTGLKQQLGNFDLGKMIDIADGCVSMKGDAQHLVGAMYEKCSVSCEFAPDERERKEVEKVIDEGDIMRIARGKHVMEFFSKLVKSMQAVRLDSGVHFKAIGKLGSNGVSIAGLYALAPETLIDFLVGRCSALELLQKTHDCIMMPPAYSTDIQDLTCTIRAKV